MSIRNNAFRFGALFLPALLVALLGLPFVALLLSAEPAALATGLHHPLFLPALSLSAKTTAISLAVVLITGTPLSWWLATSTGRMARATEMLVDAPIIIPPAVLGIALLTAFGREGLFGPLLDTVGLAVPFTTTAVVIAQVVVSAPFYVQSASAAFRKVDLDVILVARTLGATPSSAFARVAVPMALPGLVAGAALSWARAIGEFGATLLFAGSLAGTTQTMPLAIYAALEADVRVAVALSLVLTAVGLGLLVLLRAASRRAS